MITHRHSKWIQTDCWHELQWFIPARILVCIWARPSHQHEIASRQCKSNKESYFYFEGHSKSGYRRLSAFFIAHCILVCLLYLVRDVEHVEKWQRLISRMAKGFQILSYEGKLVFLLFFSMACYRLRGWITYSVIRRCSWSYGAFLNFLYISWYSRWINLRWLGEFGSCSQHKMRPDECSVPHEECIHWTIFFKLWACGWLGNIVSVVILPIKVLTLWMAHPSLIE